MAKVFPLFLVVVLAVAVLCFAIPPEEQAANAYVNNDTNIMQYQFFDETGFWDIPRIPIGGVEQDQIGYKFQFEVNSGYLPFRQCHIYFDRTNHVWIDLGYSNGVLSLWSPSWEFDMNIKYNTLTPFRLEMLVGPVYNHLRVHIIINTEYIGMYNYSTGYNFANWGILFTDGWGDLYPYSYWEDPITANLAVFYTSIRMHAVDIYRRSWVDGANGYDAGYIDGMNEANDAKANLFSSFIGSIFAFFVSIASYEVLGISLLNIMIIVGSVLLLLAVLRVFLK